KCTS
ncbi:cytochrome C and Quinol oxidase polypeptide I family protein, partial [Vibrio parahaemolyticus V-223/04]